MLTDRKIATLKPKESRYDVKDENDHGRGTLVLRVAPSGSKTFVFRYSVHRKVRRLTLGEYGIKPGQLTLAMARAKYAEAVKKLEEGVDPGAEEKQKREEAALAATVQALAEEYLEKWAKPRKRSWKEDERILRADVLPEWGGKKARDITQRDVVLLLDQIAGRGAPIAANRTLALVRKIFNFAVARSIIESSPCQGIQAPAKEHRKDRVLSDEEIVKFWQGMKVAGMAEITKLALQFMLVTGQRLGEVSQLQIEQIEGDWWTIPADVAKNGQAHRVPLSPLAMRLLDRAQQISGSHYCFASPRTKEGVDSPMNPTALSHALRKNLPLMDLAPFTPHDLRRTTATHIGMLGHNRLVISKILNHVEGGVTAIYDRHSYDAEKRTAMEDWAKKIESLVPMDTRGVSVASQSGSTTPNAEISPNVGLEKEPDSPSIQPTRLELTVNGRSVMVERVKEHVYREIEGDQPKKAATSATNDHRQGEEMPIPPGKYIVERNGHFVEAELRRKQVHHKATDDQPMSQSWADVWLFPVD